MFGAVFGLSSVIGPQVGGWIVDASNWRWVFFINLPVGILAIVLIAKGLNSHRKSKAIRIDIPGMVSLILGIVPLLLGLTFGGKDYAWISWQIIGLFTISLVSLVAFVRIWRDYVRSLVYAGCRRNQSARQLTDQLVPVLKQLPNQANGMVAQMLEMIHTNPQGLYSTLLNPAALANIPQSLAGKFVPLLKLSLVDSLHTVFLIGFGFVVLGAFLTVFLGRIQISAR